MKWFDPQNVKKKCKKHIILRAQGDVLKDVFVQSTAQNKKKANLGSPFNNSSI